jgi:hypothetical protein
VVSVAVVLSPPVADVEVAVQKALADDRLVTSPSTLVGDVESMVVSRQRLLAATVRRLRDAWDAGAVSEICGMPMKAWLVQELYLSPGDAGNVMLLVHHLPKFPQVQAAFEQVRLGLGHAAVIVRGLLRLPAELRPQLEALLVDFAADHSPTQLDARIDQLLDALGVTKDSDARREKRYAERGLDLSPTFQGRWVISGTLEGEVGAWFAEALRAFDDGPGGEEDGRSPRQRRHDAAGEIARAALGARGAQPSFAGTPVGVFVAVPLEVLEAKATAAAAQLLPSGLQVGPDTARRLACGAKQFPVAVDGFGAVIGSRKPASDFTAEVRRAAYHDQRGRCAFPRCQRPVIDCHHIIWRRWSGTGTLDNAAWLCAFHHWLAHEGKWQLRRGPDRTFIWTSPHGRERIRHLEAD